MNRVMFSFMVVIAFVLKVNGQSIQMNFPHFAGRSYDFIIFKGSSQETIIKGVIPSNGIFSLIIPEKYAPYKGMARWLITGTRKGGGISMYIPGNDFSIRCLDVIPSNSNIIFNNNTEDHLLNILYTKQEKIVKRYELMQEAKKVYGPQDKNYAVFVDEAKKEVEDYAAFQGILKNSFNYIHQLIRIINLANGRAETFSQDKKDFAKSINSFIVNELIWGYLYTSGYWTSVINTWLDINTSVLKDDKVFKGDYSKIVMKLKDSPELYRSFCQDVEKQLALQKNENYINIINSVRFDFEQTNVRKQAK